MFQRIIVPVDDNDASDRAVNVAVELASKLGSTLLILHVIETPPTFTAEIAQRMPEGEFEKSLQDYGQSIVDASEKLLPEGTKHEVITKNSEKRAWQEIIDAIDEQNADLVIMGTHGREGLARAVLGSVAERVSRHAEIPVMLVR